MENKETNVENVSDSIQTAANRQFCAIGAVARVRAEAVESIIIGIVATEMGYANQTLVRQAGQEVFKYLCSMSYREFSNVKKLAKV